jgi:hypothetical protein
MATINAAFYSCKAGRPDTIKSHRVRSAALVAAGELGQIWITESGKQRQVHMSSAGTWMTVEPDSYLAVDLKAALKTEGLIESNI